MADPFIHIRNLVYRYEMPRAGPVQTLRGVDLDVARGEYVAVVGANGSGKTTLARHLNALLLPTAGEVWIDGRSTGDPATHRAIRADVQMVFQSPADQIVATVVQEDVAFGPENLGLPADELPHRVREALERVSMWPLRDRPPHLLSAGQQQRLAVAGALAVRPRCIVFDEATAMLDPAGRRDLLEIIDGLHTAGLTIITITHAMQEAARAGRVVVMHRGQIALDGSPADVFAHPDLPSWGLLPPPAARLAARLRARGLDLPPVLAVDELADALQEAAR